MQTIVTGAGDETLRFWNVFPSAKTTVSFEITSILGFIFCKQLMICKCRLLFVIPVCGQWGEHTFDKGNLRPKLQIILAPLETIFDNLCQPFLLLFYMNKLSNFILFIILCTWSSPVLLFLFQLGMNKVFHFWNVYFEWWTFFLLNKSWLARK